MHIGSSDLWVTGDVPQTTSLGVKETLTYAIGKATGDVQAATLGLGDYTVTNQAYRTTHISFYPICFLPFQCSAGTRHLDLLHEYRGPRFLRTHWFGPKLWV